MKSGRSFFFLSAMVMLGLFFAIGLALAGFGFNWAAEELLASEWPVAEGHLIEARLDRHESAGVAGRGRELLFQVVAKYGYTVNGVAYTGRRVGLHYAGSEDRGQEQRLLGRLRAAPVLGVRYRRFHPEESVLTAGLLRTPQNVVVFGLVWLTVVTGLWKLVLVLAVEWARAANEGLLMSAKEARKSKGILGWTILLFLAGLKLLGWMGRRPAAERWQSVVVLVRGR